MNASDSSSRLKSLKTPTRPRQSQSEFNFPFKSTSVILVGPAGLAKEGLAQILKAYHFRSIVESETLASTIIKASSKSSLVIITDLSVEPDLAKTLGSIRTDNPALRFMLLVDVSDRINVENALRVPVHAYISHKMSGDALIKAIELVLTDGAVFFSMEIMTNLLSRAYIGAEQATPTMKNVISPFPFTGRPLSEREVNILYCLTDCASNKLIANRFGIAESTVKIHVKGILRKINARNRTQAAIWALARLPAGDPCSNGRS